METFAVNLILRRLSQFSSRDRVRYWTMILLLCDANDTLLCRSAIEGTGFSEQEIDLRFLDDLLHLGHEYLEVEFVVLAEWPGMGAF